MNVVVHKPFTSMARSDIAKSWKAIASEISSVYLYKATSTQLASALLVRHNPRKPDARALGRQRRSLRTPAPDTEPLGLYTGAGKGIFTVLVRHPGLVDLQQVQQNPLAEYCEVYVTSAGGVVCGMNMNDSAINSGSWRVRTANTDQKLYFAIRNNVTLDISQQGQKYPLVIQHGNGQRQLFIGIHVRNIELTG